MSAYKIFDESLPDSYIEKLDPQDLDLLIEEATQEHLSLEREIDALVWKEAPQIAEDGTPINKVWPSEFAYDAIFYRDEISENPKFAKELKTAQQLSERVGRVKAVLGSAKTQKAQQVALFARLEEEAEKL